jgi:uncharacterized protein with GYD domain
MRKRFNQNGPWCSCYNRLIPSGRQTLLVSILTAKKTEEKAAMPKYISLVNYTAKSIENIKDSPSRLDAVKKLCESMDAKVASFYLTMGRYDIVLIVDAPDAATVAKNGSCNHIQRGR